MPSILRADSEVSNQIGNAPLGTPTHILYREIKLYTSPIRFAFSKRYRPIATGAGGPSIEEFLRNIGTYSGYDGDALEPTGPLDIPVKRHFHLVIGLDRSDGLTFRAGGKAGLTLGDYFQDDQSLADTMYSSLRYVDDRGNIRPVTAAGCRTLLLTVVSAAMASPGTNPYQQPINFHVIDGGGTPLTIDPDIRYPGTGGN